MPDGTLDAQYGKPTSSACGREPLNQSVGQRIGGRYRVTLRPAVARADVPAPDAAHGLSHVAACT